MKVKYYHWSIHILLFLLDSLTITLCYWAGSQIWLYSFIHAKNVSFSMEWLQLLIFILLFHSIVIWTRTTQLKSNIVHVIWLRNLLKSLFISFFIILLFAYLTKSLFFDDMHALLTFILILPCFIIERNLFDHFWQKWIIKKSYLKKIIIYGAGHTGKRLARVIKQYPRLGYQPLGFIDDFKFKRSECVLIGNPLPILGGKDELKEMIKSEEMDEIFVAMPNASLESMVDIKELCEEYQVPYKFVPSLNKLINPQVRVEQLAGIPLFTDKELTIPYYRLIAKRIFDILFSLIMLILAIPLWISIALLIKKDSPGPCLFKQKRIGQHGNEFIMYKFRTMYRNTSPYALHPSSLKDPRITKIGRFLRKTCLDEFPQFWNVLKGEMSVVGPRPEMNFIVKEYNKLHRERLNIKPGITGLWQISGDRSLPIHENIDHDLYYIENQSLLVDMIIILETIHFIFHGIGRR